MNQPHTPSSDSLGKRAQDALDDAPTSRHGERSVSGAPAARATRGLSPKHWKGAGFVLVLLVLVFAALALFLGLRGYFRGEV